MQIINPEKREIICFIHRGRSLFLECATAQAFACGYLPIVIGDDAARCQSEAQYFRIEEFFESAESFAATYKHRSPNSYDYELFCYQRWFVGLEFMKLSGTSMWFSDHDILLFPGIEHFSRLSHAFTNGPMIMNSAWLNYVSSIDYLVSLTQYFLTIQRDAATLDELAARFTIDGTPVVSDMHAMIVHAESVSTPVLNTAYRGSSLGLDENFRLPGSYKARNGHKSIEWIAGLPHCRTSDGELHRFYSFHFQGPSKVLMDRIHTIQNPTHLANIETLSGAIGLLSDDPLGRLVRDEYLALRTEMADRQLAHER